MKLVTVTLATVTALAAYTYAKSELVKESTWESESELVKEDTWEIESELVEGDTWETRYLRRFDEEKTRMDNRELSVDGDSEVISFNSIKPSLRRPLKRNIRVLRHQPAAATTNTGMNRTLKAVLIVVPLVLLAAVAVYLIYSGYGQEVKDLAAKYIPIGNGSVFLPQVNVTTDKVIVEVGSNNTTLGFVPAIPHANNTNNTTSAFDLTKLYPKVTKDLTMSGAGGTSSVLEFTPGMSSANIPVHPKVEIPVNVTTPVIDINTLKPEVDTAVNVTTPVIDINTLKPEVEIVANETIPVIDIVTLQPEVDTAVNVTTPVIDINTLKPEVEIPVNVTTPVIDINTLEPEAEVEIVVDVTTPEPEVEIAVNETIPATVIATLKPRAEIIANETIPAIDINTLKPEVEAEFEPVTLPMAAVFSQKTPAELLAVFEQSPTMKQALLDTKVAAIFAQYSERLSTFKAAEDAVYQGNNPDRSYEMVVNLIRKLVSSSPNPAYRYSSELFVERIQAVATSPIKPEVMASMAESMKGLRAELSAVSKLVDAYLKAPEAEVAAIINDAKALSAMTHLHNLYCSLASLSLSRPIDDTFIHLLNPVEPMPQSLARFENVYNSLTPHEMSVMGFQPVRELIIANYYLKQSMADLLAVFLRAGGIAEQFFKLNISV